MDPGAGPGGGMFRNGVNGNGNGKGNVNANGNGAVFSEERSPSNGGNYDFAKVSVISHFQLSDADGTSIAFQLRVKTPYTTSHIQRGFRHFVSLHQQLGTMFSSDFLPLFPQSKSLSHKNIEKMKTVLELYLIRLASIKEVCQSYPFLDFLDDRQSGISMQLNLYVTSQNAQATAVRVEELQKSLIHANSTISEATLVIDRLCKRVSSLESYVQSLPDGAHQQVSQIGGLSSTAGVIPPTPTATQTSSLFSDGFLGGLCIHSSTDLGMSGGAQAPLPPPGLLSSLDEDQSKLPVSTPGMMPLLDANVPHFFDMIVKMVQPTPQEEATRVKIVSYLSRQVRLTLGAYAFEYGIQALRCYSSKSPVQLSLFIGKNENNVLWYLKFNDRLCRLAGGVFDETQEANSKAKDSLLSSVTDLGEPLCEPLASPRNRDDGVKNPRVTNVSFESLENDEYKLMCLVDSTVPVHVLLNTRAELCLTVFCEVFDNLVGRDHLFKRSIAAIRSWWVYDGLMDPRAVSDEALAIIVCAVFNSHYKSIECVADAFNTFMNEYSDVDFANTVLTILGPVPHHQFMRTSLGINEFTPKEGMLISEQLYNTYCRFTSSAFGEGTGSASDMSKSDMMIAFPFVNRPINMIPADAFKHEDMRNALLTLNDKMRAVALTMRSECGPNALSQAGSVLYKFFSGTVAAHTDRLPSLLALGEGRDYNSYVVPLQRLYDRVFYIDLLLGDEINDAALRLLSIELLVEKGSLPVGEIGKMLQDSISMNHLSSSLKEKYGGLKKFLERYPEHFVLR